MSDSAASDLKGRTLHATKWASLLSLSMQLGRMLVHFVLAWLLGPETFGIAARVLAVGYILDMAAEFGFIAAIIQRKDLTDKHVATAFSANIILSIALGIFGYAGLKVWMVLFGSSDFLHILQGIAALPLVFAIGHVPQALKMRDLDYRSITSASIAGTLAYIAVAIGMGFLGFGAWSVLGGFYANYLVMGVLLWRGSKWRITLGFGWSEFRELVGFGFYHAMSKVLNAVTRGLDVLMIGDRLGNASAGIYSIGTRVGAVAVGQVSSVLNSVMFSTFSRLQDDLGRMGSAYLKSTRYMALASTPFVIVAYAMVPILPLIIGSQWNDAVEISRILCFYAFWTGAGATLVPPLLSGLGRSDHSFYIGIIRTALQVACLMIGMEYGLVASAWSIVVYQVLGNLAAQWFVTVGLKVSMGRFVRSILDSMMGFVVAVAAIHGIEHVMPRGDWWTVGGAVVGSLGGLVSFLLVVHVMDRSIIRELYLTVRGVLVSRRSR